MNNNKNLLSYYNISEGFLHKKKKKKTLANDYFFGQLSTCLIIRNPFPPSMSFIFLNCDRSSNRTRENNLFFVKIITLFCFDLPKKK